MAFGQGGLDRGLALQQPVERGIEFVVGNRAETEGFAEAGGGRVRRQRPGGGELGDGIEDTPDQQGQDEVAATVAVRAEQAVEADPARGAESGGGVPARAERTAAPPWPCGRLRVTVKASCPAGMTVPPLSPPRSPSMCAGDQSERLHSVRLRTLPSWR